MNNSKKERVNFLHDRFVRDLFDIRDQYGRSASQAEISEVTGISQATLSRIINGSTPKMKDFIKVCEKTGNHPAEYFEKSYMKEGV